MNAVTNLTLPEFAPVMIAVFPIKHLLVLAYLWRDRK